MTWSLIVVNVLVFLWELWTAAPGRSPVVLDWGLVPARLLAEPLDDAPTVLVSMFMHGSWAHLGGNMLFLWIFGDNVEDAMGRGRYLVFYLAAGSAAAAAQIAVDPASAVPMVGASGAIAGVVAGYGLLYPRSPILVLNPIVPLWLLLGPFLLLPAWLIILEFFAWNLVSGFTTVGRAAGGVAFFAHLGGFVAGLLLLRLFVQDRRERYPRWEGWRPLPARRADLYDWRVPPRRDPW